MPVKKTTTKTKENEVVAKIQCINCGTLTQANFYQARDKFRGFFKKMPYCKTCVKEIYKYYYKKYDENSNLAIYFLCRKIDIPYIHSNYVGAVNNVNNDKSKIKGEDEIVSAYFKGFALAERNGWGASFDDSQGENEIQGLASFEEVVKIKRNLGGQNFQNVNDKEYYTLEFDIEVLELKWGNYLPDDLKWLENEYLDWDERLGGVNDKLSDIIVRQICLQSLEIKKERELDVNVDKKVATLLKLIKESGLDVKNDNLAEVKNVGMLISDIEHKRPIISVDPDFQDVDKIQSLIVGFLGSLFRAMDVENSYTAKFDEVYGKYSIDLINQLQATYSENIDIQKEVDAKNER